MALQRFEQQLEQAQRSCYAAENLALLYGGEHHVKAHGRPRDGMHRLIERIGAWIIDAGRMQVDYFERQMMGTGAGACGKRKYAIFTARFNPLVGGVEKFSENLAKELAEEGEGVTVVTSAIGEPPGTQELASGITLVRLPCYSLLGGRLPISKRNKQYKRLMNRLQASGISRILVNNRFYRHSLEGLKLAKKIGVRPIVLDHGTAHLTLGTSALADWTIRQYEHVVTWLTKRYKPLYCGISKRSAAWLGHFGIETDLVIPNAINAGEFTGSASGRDFRSDLGIGDAPLAVFVGRLTPEKGPDLIVEAASLVEDKNAQFILVGDGYLRPQLETDAPNNVHFTGILPAEDVSALLQQADMFVLPTKSEGFCTALLEASACALPAIITDVGGVQELIPDKSCGMIITSMSSVNVKLAVETMLSIGPEGRAQIGKAARKNVTQHYNWKASAEKMRQAFKVAEGAREP